MWVEKTVREKAKLTRFHKGTHYVQDNFPEEAVLSVTANNHAGPRLLEAMLERLEEMDVKLGANIEITVTYKYSDPA